jgi:hypothetical protein
MLDVGCVLKSECVLEVGRVVRECVLDMGYISLWCRAYIRSIIHSDKYLWKSAP